MTSVPMIWVYCIVNFGYMCNAPRVLRTSWRFACSKFLVTNATCRNRVGTGPSLPLFLSPDIGNVVLGFESRVVKGSYMMYEV